MRYYFKAYNKNKDINLYFYSDLEVYKDNNGLEFYIAYPASIRKYGITKNMIDTIFRKGYYESKYWYRTQITEEEYLIGSVK